jgi:sugar lactone lactonase YvrE
MHQLSRCIVIAFTTTAMIIHAAGAGAHPPSGIVVDDDGRVFFQDGLKGVWRVEEGRRPTLFHPLAWHWMALDPNGKFANAPEQFGEWFGRVTPAGVKPALVVCSDFPCAIGKDGNLYFAYMHSLKIMRRTPDGTQSVFVSPEQFDVEATRPYGVTGLACGSDGRLYLFSLNDDSGDHGIYTVAMDGSIQTFAANFVKDKIPDSQRHPEAKPEYCRGLALDEQGNVYIAVTGNRCVMKLTPNVGPSVVLTAKKPWTPTGVAVHNGELYVLEYDDETPTEGRNWPPRVRKVARDGKVTVVAAIQR